MQPAYRRRDAPVSPGDAAAAQTRANADEFKLHFPIPRDRTMRRIAWTQLALLVISPASCATSALVSKLANLDEIAAMRLDSNLTDYYRAAATILAIIGIASLIGIFVMDPIRSAVMARRYGWRAVSDPIEANRVATREGLADAFAAKHPGQEYQPLDVSISHPHAPSVDPH